MKPLFDLISGDVTFKLTFPRGGAGKFLRATRHLVEDIRKNRNRGPTPAFLQYCSTGGFMQEMKHYDPHDPS